MENKNVGWLLLSVCVLIIVIIFLFNSALKEIVISSCGEEHGLVCTMNDAINKQTYLSLAIVGVLIVLSVILIFTKQKEKIIVRKIKEKNQKAEINMHEMPYDE